MMLLMVFCLASVQLQVNVYGSGIDLQPMDVVEAFETVDSFDPAEILSLFLESDPDKWGVSTKCGAEIALLVNELKSPNTSVGALKVII